MGVCKSLKATHMRMEAIYSVYHSKGGSHHHMHMAETQRWAVEWENCIVERREGSTCDLEIVAWDKLEGQLEVGHPM